MSDDKDANNFWPGVAAGIYGMMLLGAVSKAPGPLSATATLALGVAMPWLIWKYGRS